MFPAVETHVRDAMILHNKAERLLLAVEDGRSKLLEQSPPSEAMLDVW